MSLNLASETLQLVITQDLAFVKLNTNTSFENAEGGDNNDTLQGNALSNRLDGGAGDDNLLGSGMVTIRCWGSQS